jgi:hypothetical protein
MKIVAVILTLLGFLLTLTGISLLRDYWGYKLPIEAQVVQVDGREPVFQLPETNAIGRPVRLRYGHVSGTGIDRVPDERPMYSVGDKVRLLHPAGKPQAARLEDSFSYSAVFWTMVLGLLSAAGGIGLFVYAWKRPPKAAPAPTVKPKRPPAQRIGI